MVHKEKYCAYWHCESTLGKSIENKQERVDFQK